MRPAGRGADRLEDDPVADVVDQSVGFGKGYEIIGVNQPLRRVLPADQRLDALDPARRQAQLRLVMQAKLALFEGCAQGQFFRQQIIGGAAHGGRIEAIFAQTLGLGGVHRGVGGGEDLVIGGAMFARKGDADRELDPERLGPHMARLADDALQPVNETLDLGMAEAASEKQREFIAAQPPDQRRIGAIARGAPAARIAQSARHQPQPVRHRAEQLVAARMAEAVIDLFEFANAHD